MPIYEYRCAQCGHELEVLQKISDPPREICPACHAPALKKLISPVGFRLKGNGWYETDFKQGNRKNLHDSGDAPKEKKPTEGEKKTAAPSQTAQKKAQPAES